jgi:hypothetical protein
MPQVWELNLELSISRRIVQATDTVRNAGYDVYQPHCAEDVLDLVRRTGRKYQTPMLSVARNDFTDAEAIWLFLMHGDKVIGGFASKTVDLRNESFEDYMRRTSKHQYNRNEDPIERVSPVMNKMIYGRHAYLGELELHESYRGKRSVVSAFAKIVMGITFLRWPEINCAYAFIAEHHRRLTYDYGFCCSMLNPITWKDPVPDGRRSDHTLALITRDQFFDEWR